MILTLCALHQQFALRTYAVFSEIVILLHLCSGCSAVCLFFQLSFSLEVTLKCLGKPFLNEEDQKQLRVNVKSCLYYVNFGGNN